MCVSLYTTVLHNNTCSSDYLPSYPPDKLNIGMRPSQMSSSLTNCRALWWPIAGYGRVVDPGLGPVHTPATMSQQRSTLSKQHSTLLTQTATMSTDSIVKFRLSTMSNVASTLLPFMATMLPLSATLSIEISSFSQIEHVQLISTLSKGRSRKIEISFDIVAKTATMSKQHSTLSKESFNL